MRRVFVAQVLLTSLMILAVPAGGRAGAQEGRPEGVGERWLSRIDPWHEIPTRLARRFGESALSAGLTRSEVVRLLNDDRFVAAVGAPDQGWGLLEAMVEDPASIAAAWALLRDRGDELTTSGATSFQYALMLQDPELRNPYLADLGHVIAVRPDGVEVLVDIETGRQITGRDSLGIPILAPGGAPLPTPSISPEEAAAMIWEEAGVDPDDPSPGEDRVQAQPDAPPGPGMNFSTDDRPPTLYAPALYLILGGFVLTWVGYAAVMILKRLRRS